MLEAIIDNKYYIVMKWFYRNIFILLSLICLTVSAQNTKISSGTLKSGHYYVDLGLSVPWATCNIGASYPQKVGEYFSWGEIASKTSYTWENYKFLNKSKSVIKNSIFEDDEVYLTKYTNIQNLDKQDDAATVKWGGAWRMPTETECNELVTKCQWKSLEYNGVEGFKVIGPNGNSIFLPASGRKNKADIIYEHETLIWSSSVKSKDSEQAIIISAGETDIAAGLVGMFTFGLVDESVILPPNIKEDSRYYGIPIRPVYGARTQVVNNQTTTTLSIKTLKEHVFGYVKTPPIHCNLSIAKSEMSEMFGAVLSQYENLLSWNAISKPVGYNVTINGKKIDGASLYVDGNYKSWSYEIFDLKNNTTFHDSEKFVIKLRNELEADGYVFITTSADNNKYVIESRNKDVNIQLECSSASKFSTHDSWKISIEFRSK